MADELQIAELERTAQELRRHLIEMMGYDKTHHFGGSLSCVEIITALYFYKMRYDPSNPNWEGRDRFVMSKGHAVPAQYAALAMLGVIPMEQLSTLKRFGSPLQGHPSSRMTPGIEACTGSLGQGLSYGNGIAMAARIRKMGCRVYVLLGDGELQEGQVWEAVLGAAAHRLDTLVALVDYNGIQCQGSIDSSKPLAPLADKWRAFRWHAIEVDGHDLGQVCAALDEAETVKGRPTAIIAHTVKGKGISFMEGRFEYHSAALSRQMWVAALREVGAEGGAAQ